MAGNSAVFRLLEAALKEPYVEADVLLKEGALKTLFSRVRVPVRVNAKVSLLYRRLAKELATKDLKKPSLNAVDFTPERLCGPARKVLKDAVDALSLVKRSWLKALEDLERNVKKEGGLEGKFDVNEAARGFSLFAKRLEESALDVLGPLCDVSKRLVGALRKSLSASFGGAYVDAKLTEELERVARAFEVVANVCEDVKLVLEPYKSVSDLKELLKDHENFGDFLEEVKEALLGALENAREELKATLEDVKEECKRLKSER